jgi:hypothetical protein
MLKVSQYDQYSRGNGNLKSGNEAKCKFFISAVFVATAHISFEMN